MYYFVPTVSLTIALTNGSIYFDFSKELCSQKAILQC